jgi:hypothetical protein
MTTTVYPLAMNAELDRQVREASKLTGLSLAEVLRQATALGLPTLISSLAKTKGRVTLVEPLPSADLARFYRRAEPDQEGINRFVAAQNLEAE